MARTTWANIMIILGLIFVVAALWEYGRYSASYNTSDKSWAEIFLALGVILILAGFFWVAYLRATQKKQK